MDSLESLHVSSVEDVVFRTERLEVWYGSTQAFKPVSMDIGNKAVTALIGPSGCGKSSFLRCLNRMNDSDLIDGARVKGKVYFRGVDIYGSRGRSPLTRLRRLDRELNRESLRSRIGMVFQKPNPFPFSISENICFGPDVNGFAYERDELIERTLRMANLWDEVKDKLNSSAQSLSGGQQQRLCVARALALNPEVLLMDEPCSALDPISTSVIEDLILQLKERFTIVFVTHNLDQARRVSTRTAFFNTAAFDGTKVGYLAEYGSTEQVFSNPLNEDTRAYVSGDYSGTVLKREVLQ